MNKFDKMLKIADIHAARIALAISRIGHLFPMKAETVQNMKEDDLAWVEIMINRFGKLQDLIGTKIIDVFFDIHQENTINLTMIDKIHKLEKLEIIPDAETWKDMRKVRNHIAHEYPDQPEITATI